MHDPKNLREEMHNLRGWYYDQQCVMFVFYDAILVMSMGTNHNLWIIPRSSKYLEKGLNYLSSQFVKT